uniref:Putative NAD(P)-dependent oxidoreductase, GFO/IDH/MOCA family n=1 Tax=Magnetococcus massalia (strain MO-1) TaxID=451514 RepID=A0A1S7LG84_MAGMO|nr:putative NAD(P)-dependent oxidoreductase, GFO/IDH/MOCA family [Candidatus Magnetococcus massalia]
MINIGVIGYGYWGPNIVRNFMSLPHARVVGVSDLDGESLKRVGALHPDFILTQDAMELINNSSIDAVAVVTPVETHFDLAMAALKAGKHVLVEKPLCQTAEQAKLLNEEAQKRGLTLMVDHTFLFSGGVRKLRDYVADGTLGNLLYVDSLRINLGLFQQAVDVIWDLAVHDLSIMEYLLGETPTRISATGAAHFPGRPMNTAFATLFYDSGTVAHINVNWLAPVKIRRLLVGGDKKMVVYDELDPSEQIKLYDKGVDLSDDPKQELMRRVSYRTGDMLAPSLDRIEPLKAMTGHFVDSIEQSSQPLTHGAMGGRIVALLEAMSSSVKQNGTPVDVNF